MKFLENFTFLGSNFCFPGYGSIETIASGSEKLHRMKTTGIFYILTDDAPGVLDLPGAELTGEHPGQNLAAPVVLPVLGPAQQVPYDLGGAK
jgi:hypothetical protein